MNRTAIERLDVTTRPLYLEHLITLADIDDDGVHHEVGTKGDLRRVEAVHHEMVLQQAGIEHDVTMVRDEQILLVTIETFETRAAKPCGAACDDLFIDTTHRIVLELLHRLEVTYPLPNGLKGFVRIDEVGQQREYVAGGDAFHRCRDLVLVIRTNIVELRVLFHILHILFNPIEKTVAPPTALFRSFHVAGPKAMAASIVQDVLVGHMHGR